MSMKSNALPIPGIVFGSYPERRASIAKSPRRRTSLLERIARTNPIKRYRRDVRKAAERFEQLSQVPAEELQQHLLRLREQMSRDGLADELIVEAFAIISHICVQTLDLRPFDTQLIAARIMLDNRLAEMATGEGKTLSAGLCAATAALAGIPVHVMTSNDYLVSRDAEKLGGLYSALGLSVAHVAQAMNVDQRRQAYSADITYCTAKELVFDYLRDGVNRKSAKTELHRRATRLASGTQAPRETVLRGLCMAIVDEADSILIDEARVPLILSEQIRNETQYDYHKDALRFAESLVEDTDYRLNRNSMSATLTAAGCDRLEQMTAGLSSVWRNRLHREEIICHAIAALYAFQRDRHYIVEGGAVQIIDEMTGRVSPGRAWSRGLHQLIEFKEGCDISGETTTAAQITYQRFFQKYLCLGGMSGTINEAHAELRSVYGLDVVKVPLRQPGKRKLLPTVVYADRQSKWIAAVSHARKLKQSGQPVLIGTDTVAESEILSTLLAEAGIEHTVLNARQDKSEAEIVASAGSVGSITVATNMAGRGTDIPLGAGAAECGGLHVISCQHNTSRRIDRQLIGRCARQGDPGSAQILICLEQPLIQRTIPRWLRRIASRQNGLTRPRWLVNLIARLPQKLEERRQRDQRRKMLAQDLKADSNLAHAGELQ